jgi:hypothetical protein
MGKSLRMPRRTRAPQKSIVYDWRKEIIFRITTTITQVNPVGATAAPISPSTSTVVEAGALAGAGAAAGAGAIPAGAGAIQAMVGDIPAMDGVIPTTGTPDTSMAAEAITTATATLMPSEAVQLWPLGIVPGFATTADGLT